MNFISPPRHLFSSDSSDNVTGGAPGLAKNIGNLAMTGTCQLFAQPSSYDCENDELARYFIRNYRILNIGPDA